MAKRRKVVTFHSWLSLAMEDVFLGRLIYASVNSSSAHPPPG